MINVHYKIYLGNTRLLARSLLIHSQDAAQQVQNELEFYGAPLTRVDVDETDPQNWKYYLNIRGIRHVTNTEVLVFVSEYSGYLLLLDGVLYEGTEGIVEIDGVDTPVILQGPQATPYEHNLLRVRSAYGALGFGHVRGYLGTRDVASGIPTSELVVSGNEDDEYILGAIYGCLYDEPWNEPDGTILRYDETLVDKQEESLIESLSNRIVLQMERYRVADYGAHNEFYGIAMLGVIATELVGFILSHRLDTVRTPEVHSYHLWTWLASHGIDLRYQRYLLPSQAMWLYRNLEQVRSDDGSQETFHSVLENLLVSSGMGIFGYDIRPDGQFQHQGRTHRYFRYQMLGDSSHDAELSQVSPGKIAELFRTAVPNTPESQLILAEETVARLHLVNKKDITPTKLVDCTVINREGALPITITAMIHAAWGYYANNDVLKIVQSVEVKNISGDNEVISIGTREAFDTFYLLNQGLGSLGSDDDRYSRLYQAYAVEQKTFEVTLFALVRDTPHSEDEITRLRTLAKQGGIPWTWVNGLLVARPSSPNAMNYTQFIEYMERCHDFVELLRKFRSGCNSLYSNMYAEIITSSFMMQSQYTSSQGGYTTLDSVRNTEDMIAVIDAILHSHMPALQDDLRESMIAHAERIKLAASLVNYDILLVPNLRSAPSRMGGGSHTKTSSPVTVLRNTLPMRHHLSAVTRVSSMMKNVAVVVRDGQTKVTVMNIRGTLEVKIRPVGVTNASLRGQLSTRIKSVRVLDADLLVTDQTITPPQQDTVTVNLHEPYIDGNVYVNGDTVTFGGLEYTALDLVTEPPGVGNWSTGTAISVKESTQSELEPNHRVIAGTILELDGLHWVALRETADTPGASLDWILSSTPLLETPTTYASGDRVRVGTTLYEARWQTTVEPGVNADWMIVTNEVDTWVLGKGYPKDVQVTLNGETWVSTSWTVEMPSHDSDTWKLA